MEFYTVAVILSDYYNLGQYKKGFDVVILDVHYLKRNIFPVLMFCCLFHSSSAQVFNFGPRIGMHTLDIDAREIVVSRGDVDYRAIFDEARIGVNTGLALRFNLNNFFIQPEAIIKSQRMDYSWSDLSNPDEFLRLQFKYYDLEFPVMFGFKFGPARIGAGFVGNTMISSYSDLAQGRGSLSSFRYGGQLGIGLDLNRLFIDVKYESSLNGLGDELVIDGATYTFDSRPERFIFSLGWFFLKPD